MPIPITKFKFITNGLRVFFEDQSTESPTSWLWNFGHGGPVSTLNDPTELFPTTGSYTVSLTTVNGFGTSEPTLVIIHVNEANLTSLADMITFELPLSITMSATIENYYINKWRVFLQAGLQIADEYLNDETQYKPLQNVLIAKLVVYDYILKLAKDFMASTMGGTGSVEGQQGGNIKKIETGPTNAEWYSGSQTLSDFFKPGTGTNGGSAFDDLMSDICGIANHHTVRVKVPMCALIGTNPMTPIKSDIIKYLGTNHFINFDLNANQ